MSVRPSARVRLAVLIGEAADQGLQVLTPGELEVLILLAHGMSNAELAGRLHVSEATVKTHVARLLAK